MEWRNPFYHLIIYVCVCRPGLYLQVFFKGSLKDMYDVWIWKVNQGSALPYGNAEVMVEGGILSFGTFRDGKGKSKSTKKEGSGIG